MTSRIIAIGIVSLIHVGCGVVNNPFKPDTVRIHDACDFDFEQTVELERVRFTPSAYWSVLTPCDLVKISRDTHRDSWRVSVMGVFSYGDVVGVSGIAHFGIGTDIHLIGKPVDSPEEWLASRKVEWNEIPESHDHVERVISRVRHGALDCWRIASKSYKRTEEKKRTDEQTHAGVGYTCWESGNNRYHPIGFSAGINYQDGEPIYDIDIDQLLLRPVLESIELKDLSAEAYEQRLKDHERWVEEDCKWRVKNAYKMGLPNISDYGRNKLRECGYNPNTLERIDQ